MSNSQRGTKQRQVRMKDDLYLPALEKADRLGVEGGFSGVVRDFVEWWLQQPDSAPWPGSLDGHTGRRPRGR